MLTGIQVTVGIYSYFLTNMLALSLAFFSVGSLFVALRRGSKGYFFGSILLGGLLPYVHPWSFDQFLGAAGVLTILVGYVFLKTREEKPAVRVLALYVLSLICFDVTKTLLFHGVGGFLASTTVASGLAGLGEFWSSSIFSFRYLYGGSISNAPLLFLALIGVFLLSWRDANHRFWVVFLFVSSLVFLVGDDTIKSRLLFNVPFSFFAALGLDFLVRVTQNARYRSALFFFFILSSFTYLFRSLANLS